MAFLGEVEAAGTKLTKVNYVNPLNSLMQIVFLELEVIQLSQGSPMIRDTSGKTFILLS